MIIYKITNTQTGKAYIGQTCKTLRARYSSWEKGYSVNRKINEDAEIYGREIFKFEVLKEASSREELNSLEKLYIEKFNTLSPNGYNLQGGGKGKKVLSDETRRRLSEKQMGPKNHMYGKKKSEEWKAAMSARYKGKFLDPNWKTNLTGRKKGTCNLNLAKKVRMVTPSGEEKIFVSMALAAKEGFLLSGICKCCKGLIKQHKGHKFSYVEGASE